MNDDETVGAQGIEFWTTITEQELDRHSKGQQVLGYIDKSKDNLV
jgi:hypothetical protein